MVDLADWATTAAPLPTQQGGAIAGGPDGGDEGREGGKGGGKGEDGGEGAATTQLKEPPVQCPHGSSTQGTG